MKRKKWTEEEERTLLSECSVLLSSTSIAARLRTRQKKFQPIADRVNAAHHLCDPSAFPFLWSWRDVSVKVQNMRHQYLNVKLKLGSPLDTDHALLLWPNFLRYKLVFGDHDLPSSYQSDLDPDENEPNELENDDIEEDFTHSRSLLQPQPAVVSNQESNHAVALRMDEFGRDTGHRGKLGCTASMVAHTTQISLRREERRREWDATRESQASTLTRAKMDREHRLEMERWRIAEEDGEERDVRRRRREERREEEEMEWRERMLVMQLEHERQVMQMHADTCQMQMNVLGLMARALCQFLGPGAGSGDGELGGLTHQVMHDLQQQQEQESPDSLVGDGGKSDVPSSEHYL